VLVVRNYNQGIDYVRSVQKNESASVKGDTTIKKEMMSSYAG